MTRSEAIKKLVNAEYADKWQGDEDLVTAQHMAIDTLEQEPKTGYWIYAGACKGGNYDEYECSECGQIIIVRKGELSEFKGCYCGAKMREVEE